MTGVTLLRPWWLLALPLLALLGWRMWSRRRGLGDWERVADPALIQVMAALGRIDGRAGRGPLLAGLAASAIAVLALAGPAVERRDTQSWRNLDGVLFVVDVSDSVTEHARWLALLTAGRFVMDRLGTRPGGLIVFAGDAYAVQDMTLDHLQLGQTLSLIEPGLVPDPGSRPGRALSMAADRLAAAEVIAGDVVLFSDGGGLGPDALAAAETIVRHGARLSVIGFTPTPQLAELARTGGGRLFTPEEAGALEDWLAQDARTRLERQAVPLLYWRDFGRWVLALAVLPLLLLFRRERA